ncbi:hypothetical protein [Mycolicibacterium sp. P1-5]|uniref:hypothetical protein n=1 Tax=Mycolicibacterium sp. P1-5 TaxID=2024617 RepID=UPI0011EE9DC6|nr:hypothetical protein [Mycolicibacterium sp. P1-5]KAA0108891.1 hypothetical protein CIW47_12790 [Mycolicibacterium sp. P1-5]
MKLRPTPREGRGWPHYIFWGRVRTSTAALLAAFIAVWWLYATYQPQSAAPVAPNTQVVPPGFVPDPSYTWVPRTDVRDRTTTTRTTTTTPTTTTTTPSTSETSPTSTTSPSPAPFQIPGLPPPAPSPAPVPSPGPAPGPLVIPGPPTQ